MKAVLASHNKHKIAELQALLSKHIPDIEILSLSDVGLEGDIVEDGETFEANALQIKNLCRITIKVKPKNINKHFAMSL